MSAFIILLRKEHSQGKKKVCECSVQMLLVLDLKYFLLVEPIHIKPEGMEDQLERKKQGTYYRAWYHPMFQGFVDQLGMYLMSINGELLCLLLAWDYSSVHSFQNYLTVLGK